MLHAVFAAAQDDTSQAAQDATRATVVDASGQMIVEWDRSTPPHGAHSTPTPRGEDPRLSGPIQLILPDRHLSGYAELELSFAAHLGVEEELWTSHTWGTVHATFEWTTCDGPIAWSFDREAPQTGGSMSLRCDDGSLFAARVVKERYVDGTDNHGYQVHVALQDGSYTAG